MKAQTKEKLIDVLDVFIRETSGSVTTDIPMRRLSRAEYSHITDKTSTGKPNQFFINDGWNYWSCFIWTNTKYYGQ